MSQATESNTAPAPEAHPVSRGGLADVESARAALPEAVFSLPVFTPLEKAKAYIGALNIMCLDQDLPEHFGKPLYRLVCDINDILDVIDKELHRVWVLARRASGLPDLPDDGNGEVKEAAGEVPAPDADLLALASPLGKAWGAYRSAIGRGDDGEADADAAFAEANTIARKIEELRASTIGGLRVKAMAVAWARGGNPSVGSSDTVMRSDHLLASLLRDLDAPHQGQAA